jgi:hypothetical protein
VSFQRNHDHRNNPTDGVSTYLALTFGTLLSSQGTDASFVLTLSGFPPGASLRCFRLYQIFPTRFPRCFPTFRPSGFVDSIRSLGSPRSPTPSQPGLSSRPLGRSDVSNPSGSLR